MDWPVALTEEIAGRRCIFFLGSGVTANCTSSDGTRPPTWLLFLQKLKDTIPAGTDVTVIDHLLAQTKFLDAAEIIRSKITSADFSRIVRESFVQPRYVPCSLHESVLTMDPKIVVTTNYDEVYDTFCRSGTARNGYNVSKYYDHNLVDDLRSPVRLVVKAHGCVSKPSHIILTRSEYFNVKQRYASFYAILDALFLTSTLLFIGYSLNDPDIQLVLENANIAAPSSHSHYALVPDDNHADIENAAARAYNIHFLKHPAGDYNFVENALKELAYEVTQFRISNPAV